MCLLALGRRPDLIAEDALRPVEVKDARLDSGGNDLLFGAPSRLTIAVDRCARSGPDSSLGDGGSPAACAVLASCEDACWFGSGMRHLPGPTFSGEGTVTTASLTNMSSRQRFLRLASLADERQG
jgi:hypothetical protein